MANIALALAVSVINKTTHEAIVKPDNYFDRIKGNLIATKQICD